MKLSKKMLMTLIAMAVATAGFVASAWSPTLAGQYTVFVGAISGFLALFLTGKIGSQFVDSKATTDQHVATVNAQAKAGQTITSIKQPEEQAPIEPLPPG